MKCKVNVRQGLRRMSSSPASWPSLDAAKAAARRQAQSSSRPPVTVELVCGRTVLPVLRCRDGHCESVGDDVVLGRGRRRRRR